MSTVTRSLLTLAVAGVALVSVGTFGWQLGCSANLNDTNECYRLAHNYCSSATACGAQLPDNCEYQLFNACDGVEGDSSTVSSSTIADCADSISSASCDQLKEAKTNVAALPGSCSSVEISIVDDNSGDKEN